MGGSWAVLRAPAQYSFGADESQSACVSDEKSALANHGRPGQYARAISLHDKQEQELACTDLRPFHHQRATSAQRCIRLEQNLLILIQLEVQPITVARRTLGIDMQRKMLA